jgi:hypothetical protein
MSDSEQFTTMRDVNYDPDNDAFVIEAGSCDIVKNCGRSDLHGHSGFERGLPGGDGDFIDWWVPEGHPLAPEFERRYRAS